LNLRPSGYEWKAESCAGLRVISFSFAFSMT
jgi:hypothetical protein